MALPLVADYLSRACNQDRGLELELDAALPYLICKHRAEGCIHSNHQAVPAGVDFVRVLTL